jgi:CheY-like chemotaxis protein
VSDKVLLVDDEPAVLAGYERLLRGEFDIETAVGGEEGLAAIRDHGPFAVVVSDIRMPEMDGIQFLARVRQAAPNTIRLVLTGHAELNVAIDAINRGYIFGFLTKPCQKDELVKEIATALVEHNQRREERVRIQLPVQLCRSATEDKAQPAHTIDISNSGARLAGLQEPLKAGEVIELHCGARKAPYRVVWVGWPGTPTEDQAGLQCLAGEGNLWEFDLSQPTEAQPLLQEMAVAHTVQSRLFPQEKPPLRTLDYSGHCIQARIVGGDYYDFLDLSPGEVGFVLADVAGKGVAAALLMANLQGSLRSYQSIGSKDFPRWLASVNRHFYKHSERHRYATLFLGCYSDSTRTLRYVNCGHNPPLLLRPGDAVERLSATATVLGLFRDWECSVAEVKLETGDVLGAYTDGITEATSQQGEEFGESRLLQTLRQSRDLAAGAILQKVEQEVQQFSAGEPQDDLTLLIGRAL